MKKTIIFAFLIIFSAAAARGQSIKVLSPDGGESWPLGSERTITWQAQGISGSVKIILRRGGEKVGDIAASVPAAQGSYTWTVGTLLNGSAPAGDGYIVRVKTTDNLYGDDSRAGFRIFRLTAVQQVNPANLHPAPGDPPVFQGATRLPDLTIQDFYYKASKKVFSIQLTNLSPTTYSGYVKIKMETEPGDCPPQEKREYFPRIEKDMIFNYEIFNCDFVGNPCRMHIRVELLPENPEENHNNNVFDGMVPKQRGVNFRVADAPIRLRFSHGSKTLACNFYAYNAGNTITHNDILNDYDAQNRTAAVFLDVPIVNCGGVRGGSLMTLRVTHRLGNLTETIYQGHLLAAAVYLDPGQNQLVSRSLTIPVRQGEFYIYISSFYEPNPQCPVSFKFADEFFH